MKSKILIIRFSSFGDVTQCLSVPSALQKKISDCEIHWVVRKDLSSLLENHPAIHHIWAYDRKSGLSGLLRMIWKLRAEKFTHIYDAHNNLRSWLINLFLLPPLDLSRSFHPPQWIVRSIRRWKRFLLFNFRVNLFEQPFSGQRDLLEPLTKWGIEKNLPPLPQLFLTEADLEKSKLLVSDSDYIALAPSAAYPLKRWPIEYWEQLIAEIPTRKFVLLGGPEDHFLEQIRLKFPSQVLNTAGLADLKTSAALIARSSAVICNDTGLLHVAEQLGKPTIALMGPAPFGFPSRPNTFILEKMLYCRPCSKHGQGPCVNPHYHQCLKDISPTSVVNNLKRILGERI